MKLCLIALAVLFTTACSAQSFFKPIPKPGHTAAGKFGLATDSISNSIRPVVGVTATIQSSGAQLAGGFGVGYQHNKWDIPSQAWVTQYSISALAFLGSGANGNADVTAGIVGGFLSFISIGGGYDFTTKKVVLLTGVQLHFN